MKKKITFLASLCFFMSSSNVIGDLKAQNIPLSIYQDNNLVYTQKVMIL